MYGDSCRFQHTTFLSNGNTTFESNGSNPREHPPIHAKDTNTTGGNAPICTWWQAGMCRFGDNCRYRHGDASPSPLLTTKKPGYKSQNLATVAKSSINPGSSYFDRLSEDLILSIFRCCVDLGSANLEDYATIIRCTEVCKAWNRISRDEVIWKAICVHFYYYKYTMDKMPKQDRETWRSYFEFMIVVERHEFDEALNDFEEENERVEQGFYDSAYKEELEMLGYVNDPGDDGFDGYDDIIGYY